MTRTSHSRIAAPALLVTVLCCSSLLSAQGRDRTAPTAPANLTVTEATSNSVSLAWQPSTDNSGSFSYLVTGLGATTTVGQTQTSHTVVGLQPGKTYTVRVYAKDASGNLSKSSNPVTVTLPGQVAAPGKPAVTVLDVGPTHVSLSWSSSGEGATIWYTIFINGEQVSSSNSRSGTFTCARVMVPTYCDPINQESPYTFTIRARDGAGNLSPMSDPVFVTTDPADPNDVAPPTQPANITAANTGGFHLVTWDAATDDVAPQSLIRYDVYVNGELRTVVVGTTAAEVELYLGETSTITVIAVDTADNESAPGSITVIS
jgi:chitodextrinase